MGTKEFKRKGYVLSRSENLVKKSILNNEEKIKDKKEYNENENKNEIISKKNTKIKTKKEKEKMKKEEKEEKEEKTENKLGEKLKNNSNTKKKLKKYYTITASMLVLASLSVYTTIKTYVLTNTQKYLVYDDLSKENVQEVINKIDTLNDKTEKSMENANSNLQDEINNETRDIEQDNKEDLSKNSINFQNEESNNLDTRNSDEYTMKDNVYKESNTTNNSNSTSSENSTSNTNKNTFLDVKFAMPLTTNKILKEYSMDNLLYSNTLQMWKTHDGIDILASLGDKVMCVYNGTVERIYDDSFYGKTIVILHKSNYRSIYCNLDENVLVNVGDSIKRGKVIGYVGKSSIGEIKDDIHLHFSITLNNESINPRDVIDFK